MVIHGSAGTPPDDGDEAGLDGDDGNATTIGSEVDAASCNNARVIVNKVRTGTIEIYWISKSYHESYNALSSVEDCEWNERTGISAVVEALVHDCSCMASAGLNSVSGNV